MYFHAPCDVVLYSVMLCLYIIECNCNFYEHKKNVVYTWQNFQLNRKNIYRNWKRIYMLSISLLITDFHL